MGWADTIREAVRASGMTHYRIAKSCGLSVQSVDQFMSGADARLSTAEKIASVVGVELRNVDRENLAE